jgi:rfaE bifunctional protein kinase chain/domain
VASLGGCPTLVGAIGDDERGRQLLGELERAGVDTAGVVCCSDRATALKTRILARHAAAHAQQVARIDDLAKDPLPDAIVQELLTRLEGLVPASDAVLVSNYRAGVVTPPVTEAVVRLATEHGVPTCVDTQGDLRAFTGFTLVKSNQPDAEAALGTPLTDEDDFAHAGRCLMVDLGARDVVITRGGDGISLIEAGGRHVRLAPTNRTEVWDVTGAGDTVIAVLALGLAAGASVVESAQLANAAAGLVVRRIGVAAVTPEELAGAFGVPLTS